jgi:putative tryptophan/tyrosine transport system substrate-binding protein
MDRRAFLGTLAGALLAAPVAAEAQQTRKVPRVGVLGGQSPEISPPILALRQGLSELGYVEGENIAIEWRWAQGKNERYPDLAAELVKLKVDIIVAATTPGAQAAQRATKTIPIVMGFASDPVAGGLVANLARPGGNITGLGVPTSEMVGKRLQLLREVVPTVARIAVLIDPSQPDNRTFTAIARERAAGIIILPGSTTFAYRAHIAQLAVKHRLPTSAWARDLTEAGSLMSYGANQHDVVRRAAYFVDKILKGAKPADLPVEQPTKFDLVINLKTAKALGLTIPPSLLQRADQVIE